MLEIRNVTKVYRSKTGEQVTALDHVSVSFPETGMIFILGKSGSGKSTLLNVIGGLDSYDSGEFVIMGKSSKDFAGSDFDAYRNTFIGFIFQEYNILDDFSVGANIGLALELQGKKATNETINTILEQVDLAKFANRKPNELSGGQKQRIAIARALVKDPQIIMADEPTGALDSNTGKQIFDTLKALSKRKLVLIVSHDRDFAERYADRIIELSDGQIISDVTKHEKAAVQINDGIQQVGERILRFRPGYQLTPADLNMINAYLAKSEKGVVLSGDARINDELRSAAGLSEDGSSAVFESTDEKKDVRMQSYNGSETKFIRSRLPMKNAVKMGSSGLKHKKFRLFMTILLSLVAFSMFGIADAMAAYKKADTATRSILDSNIDNASFSLSLKTTEYNYYDGKEHVYTRYTFAAMNDEDIQSLNTRTGMTFTPVFNGSDSSSGGGISLQNFMKEYDGNIPAYSARLYGFVAMTAEQANKSNLTLLAGRMPERDFEITISKFIYNQFKQYGFRNRDHSENISGSSLTMDSGTSSILGKHLSVGGGSIYRKDGSDFDFEIVGVVDTHFDEVRFEKYLTADSGDQDTLNLSDMLLLNELMDTLTYGFHTLGFVTQNAIDEMSVNARSSLSRHQIGTYMNNFQIRWKYESDGSNAASFYRVAGGEELTASAVTRFDGAPYTGLGAKEYLVSRQTYTNLLSFRDPSEAVRFYPHADLILQSLFSPVALGYAFERSSYYGGLIEYATLYSYAKKHYAEEQDTLRDSYGIETVSAYADYLQSNGGIDPISTEDAKADVAGRFNIVLKSFAVDYGLTDFSSAPEQAVRELTNVLNNTETGGNRTISRSTIRRNLAYYDAAVEVYQNGLWEDPAVIRRFVNASDPWDEITDSEKQDLIFQRYASFLAYENSDEIYGNHSSFSLLKESATLFKTFTGSDAASEIPTLQKVEQNWEYGSYTEIEKAPYTGYTLVGYFDDPGDNSDVLISNEIFTEAMETNSYSSRTETAEHTAGVWSFAIAPMPTDHDTVRRLVDINYTDGEDLQYSMRNQVILALDSFNDFIEVAAKIFLYVGIGFAVFSALLLMNFISVSISYKRHEIGILRAVGARSSDVFKIFFSESFIIALINYVFSVIAAIVAVFFINRAFRNQGLSVTLLRFGIRQLILMFLISLAVAAIASFLPVWNIARRRPIDAIRNK